MSRIGAALDASQSLSMAAFAEAARDHRTVADLDDLLVALCVDAGLGGQALRACGIDRASIRAAITATRVDRLAGLGLGMDSPSPDASSDRRAARCEWSPRVLQLFSSVPAAHDFSAAVLRAALGEPSGHVQDVLSRTTLDRAELERVLDAARDTRAPSRRSDAGVLSGSAGTHVPAPIDEVWALLTDPSRLHEWAPAVGPSATPQPDGTWLAHAPEEGPDGRPLRTRDSVRRQLWALARAVEPAEAEWSVSYPDAPRANRQRLLLRLAPSAGGTQLDVTVQWHRTVARRAVLGRLLRPLTRWATRLGARTTAQSIAAAFR